MADALPRAWVINLDRAPDRLARVGGQLDALGLPWRRLAAVDARQLTPEQHAQLDTPGFLRRHGMAPAPGELGCYLSHLAVMQAFLATGEAHALVLEDDALLAPELVPLLRAVVRHAGRWDMVKVSGLHSGTPMRYLRLDERHHLAVMLSRCTGASAYVVNRRAAQAYLAQLLPMRLPWDHVFDQGWELGLKVRMISPRPCEHDNAIATTIAAPGGSQRKLRWWRRLPTYAYRLRTELSRVAYGLVHTLRERARG